MTFAILEVTKKVAQLTRPEYQELKQRGNEFLEGNFHDLTQKITIPEFVDEDCESTWRQGLAKFCNEVKQSFFAKLQNPTIEESIQLKGSVKAASIFNKFYAKALIESLKKVDESVSISVRCWISEQISNCPYYSRESFLNKIDQCIPASTKEHQNALQFLVNLYSVTEGEEANILKSDIWTYLSGDKLAYLFYTIRCGLNDKHDEKFNKVVIEIICALGEKHASLEGDYPAFLAAMRRLSSKNTKPVVKEVEALSQALSNPDEFDALILGLRPR